MWRKQRLLVSAVRVTLISPGVRSVKRINAGFALGGFFSLMSASFAYEDPMARAVTATSHTQRARDIFKEMGRGMWTSGKGFGKVGALFAGIECCIESVSAIAIGVRNVNLTTPSSIVQRMIWSIPLLPDSLLVVCWHETLVQKLWSAVVSRSLHFQQQ